jgi:hypothetical protein
MDLNPVPAEPYDTISMSEHNPDTVQSLPSDQVSPPPAPAGPVLTCHLPHPCIHLIPQPLHHRSQH